MKRFFALLLLVLPMVLYAKLQPTKASHVEADFVQSCSSFASMNTLVEPSKVVELTGHVVFDAPATLLWQYDNDTTAILPPDLFRILTRIFAGKPVGGNSEFSVREDGNTLIFKPKRKPLNLRYHQIEVTYNPLTGIVKEILIYMAPELIPADANSADSVPEESMTGVVQTFTFGYVTFR